MAEITTKQLLDDAKSGLDAIFKRGQSYTLDGKTFTSANASELLTIIEKLEEKYNAEQGTRPIMQTFDLSGMGYN
jgi:uncharacterized protein YllA (UPF0747 family)